MLVAVLDPHDVSPQAEFQCLSGIEATPRPPWPVGSVDDYGGTFSQGLCPLNSQSCAALGSIRSSTAFDIRRANLNSNLMSGRRADATRKLFTLLAPTGTSWHFTEIFRVDVDSELAPLTQTYNGPSECVIQTLL